MKRFFLTLAAIVVSLAASAHGEGNFKHSVFAADMKAGEKAAILMVHFGTTHDDTRELTIDRINERVKEEFPQWDFHEAYTSRIVIRRLAARGDFRKTPSQMLDELSAAGYDYVIVQPTNIIDGIEMDAIKMEIEAVRDRFKDIRLGNPLLYSPDDYRTVIAALKSELPDLSDSEAVLLVGHGTYTPVTASYAMLDYMLKAEGCPDYYVGTIEGYPAYSDAVAMMKRDGVRKVVLVPFMFVAGDHAKNDIYGEWKEALEKDGFETECFMEGLGQNPGIVELFVDHIRYASTHKEINILDKKAAYAEGD